MYKAYQAQTVKEGGFTNIPFMSDLARFYALHRYGGLYMDVDVAPGTVDLDTYFTVNHIPFLGPLLRMTEDAKNAGVYGAQDQPWNASFSRCSEKTTLTAACTT